MKNFYLSFYSGFFTFGIFNIYNSNKQLKHIENELQLNGFRYTRICRK